MTAIEEPRNGLSILLIDDEAAVDVSIGKFLRSRGHRVQFVADAAAALERFQRDAFDIVLSDIHMPGMDGLTLLGNLRRIDPEIGVILITGQGDLDTAIKAIRAGASDYILKPADLQQILLAIERTARYHTIERAKTVLEARLAQVSAREEDLVFGTSLLIGESPAIRRVRSLAEKVAANPSTTVLILGETGTGKELVARLIHRKSLRAARPFVAMNCMALPQQLIESELFGHEKGAFSGADKQKRGLIELADTGTLFLDEIGDMALDLQGRLLRVQEESSIRRLGSERTLKVDVRFLAATHQDLQELAARKDFRQDLYYRLQGFTIEIPPLRDRTGDIEMIVAHYLRHFSACMRKNVSGVAAETMSRLLRYSFPGNVRELKNMIERAVILAETETLTDEHFPPLAPDSAPSHGLDFSGEEADRIRDALGRADGNIGEAARLLNLGYGALRYRMQKLGITIEKSSGS